MGESRFWEMTPANSMAQGVCSLGADPLAGVCRSEIDTPSASRAPLLLLVPSRDELSQGHSPARKRSASSRFPPAPWQNGL